MNCVWFGGDNTAPQASGTQYNYLTPCFTSSWNSTESQRTVPISEDITLTKLTVYLDAAPGTAASGKQYTFTIRDDAADTAASLVILDTATSNTWTGSVSVAAGSLMSLAETPLNTPNGTGNNHWIIEYTTTGQ